MTDRVRRRLAIAALACCVQCSALARAFEPLKPDPQSDVMMSALGAELDRSMKDLVLEGLPRPYFIRYTADDRTTYTLGASFGGINSANHSRQRYLRTRVRVGSMQLDNTNSGGFGGRELLPWDDDATAIRHATWRATDEDYKRAVEILARKEAFLKEKTVEDRPDDFTPAPPISADVPYDLGPVDEGKWRTQLAELSARFKQYPAIKDADAYFVAGSATRWILNSEGTRLRIKDGGAALFFRAETQAPDGMPLSDELSYLARQPGELPSKDVILADIDKLATGLTTLRDAPTLDHYAGPVLFDAPAACRVLHDMLSEGFCAKPTPLGAGSGADNSFEKKLGTRILPRSFSVYDDPRETTFNGTPLAGYYLYDDEGVPASRVELVEGGILKNLLAGRAPTRKVKQTTGHARGSDYGDPEATIGCLYFSDASGMSSEELKKELIQAAKDEGLEFGIRVATIEAGGGGLGDPIAAYKVFVSDGREELIRGMEFQPVEVRALKRLLAAGRDRAVYNQAIGVSYSVVAPAILFEELELGKIEQEFDKPPILKAPLARGSR